MSAITCAAREPDSHLTPLQATESLRVAQVFRQESYYQRSGESLRDVRAITFGYPYYYMMAFGSLEDKLTGRDSLATCWHSVCGE